MTAATYNITIEQGATFNRLLTLKNREGVVIDLSTVAYVRSSIRPRAQTSEKWDFVVTITDAINGKIKWDMPALTTETIYKSSGVYDLEIEWDDGRVERLLQGDVIVSMNITRG